MIFSTQILNCTPDSFSDGDAFRGSVDAAVKAGLRMVDQGATLIDIGCARRNDASLTVGMYVCFT